MNKQVKKFRNSIQFALRGIQHAFHREQNMRIHTGAGIAIVVCGLYVGLAVHEWIAIVLAVMIVLAMELVNSGIEALSDIVKPRLHAHIGIVKDMMAGAVLVASLGALVVGLLIFIPHIIEIFGLN